MNLDRKLYLGSAEIAAIVGLNPYQTPLDVYNSKIYGEEKIENEKMKWGKLLEPVVLEEFLSQKGVTEWEYQKFKIHEEHGFLAGTADAVTENALIEIKTTALNSRHLWRSEIPEIYQLQAQWLLGLHAKDLCLFGVLFGGQELREYELNFDLEIYEMLVNKAVHFWNNYVLTQTPPE